MGSLKLRFFCFLICLLSFVVACGGGGGGSGTTSNSGTVTMSVTDAKPFLPENVTNLFVEFSEVWVHKPGGGWIELALEESPYTIDLLQFQDGNTTELVPPTRLSSGKYTQVRFVVSGATLRVTHTDDTTTDWIVEIPSENLKTDKNFTLDLGPDTAIDLIVHFDLSMSLVVSGSESEPEYKLKPVLHLFDSPPKAAVIDGSFVNSSFGASEEATITVFSDRNHEVFTQVVVPKSTDSDPTEFSIFWIVPDESYTVEIDLNQDGTIDCTEFVEDIYLVEGEVFDLNDGYSIESGDGICNP